jgi:hypothetical protein
LEKYNDRYDLNCKILQGFSKSLAICAKNTHKAEPIFKIKFYFVEMKELIK